MFGAILCVRVCLYPPQTGILYMYQPKIRIGYFSLPVRQNKKKKGFHFKKDYYFERIGKKDVVVVVFDIPELRLQHTHTTRTTYHSIRLGFSLLNENCLRIEC